MPRHPHSRSLTAVRARALAATTLAALVLASCAGAEPGGGAGVSPGQQAQGDTSGTTGLPANPNLQGDVALEPFNSCDDLLGWIKQQALPHVTAYGLEGYGGENLGVPPGAIMEDSAGRPATTMPPTTFRTETTMSTQPMPGQGQGGAASTTTAGGSDNKSAPTAPSSESSTPGGGGPDHSETNNQEKDVDEPDTVKNDGDRLFMVDNNRIVSFADLGSTPVLTGTLSLDYSNISNHQMLLAGDRLIVLSSSYSYGRPIPMERDSSGGVSRYQPSGAMTMVQIVDVADMARMKVIDRVGVDGSLVSARFANGKMRVVTSSHPASFSFVSPNGRGAEQAAKEANTKIINDSKIEDWLPRMYLYGGGAGYVSSPESKQLLACNAVSRPKDFGGLGVLSVLSIDPKDTVNPGNNVGVMGDGDTVYASSSNLYVATNEVRWGTPVSAGGSTNTTIVDDGSTGGRPCTVGGPRSDVMPRCGPIGLANHHTAVHKFDLAGSGPAAYRASGKFEGSLLSQYSMSEQGGILRAATTSSSSGTNASMGSESQVVALREDAGELKVVGRVNGLGTNEAIKAVRFLGNAAYVVTFRQTDPLYTIDLSDPTSPRVVGELKILGYSAYLHPVGDGYLLGVGQDATETGRTTGTQVQLIDVRDLANPKLVQKLVIPGGNSEAELDPHAFLWWARNDLAVIPVTKYAGFEQPVPMPTFPSDCPTCGSGGGVSRPQTNQPFMGVVGFTVRPDGIKEVGSIQHHSSNGYSCGGPAVDCVEPPSTTIWCPPGSSCPTPTPTFTTIPPPAYPVQITRSVVAGANLLTLSSAGLKSNDLGSFAEKTWVPLR